MSRKKRNRKTPLKYSKLSAASRNKSREVDKILQKALKHHSAAEYKEASKSYQQILTIHPSHFDALHMLGVLTCQEGKPVAGIELMRKAIAGNPTSDACHNNLGKALHDQGETDEAISSFRKAVSLNPNSTAAMTNLANALTDSGHYMEAVACCQRALELQPNYAEAYNNLGNALENLERTKEAEAAYRRASELKPDFAAAHYNLGNILVRLGEYEEALTSFKKAVTYWPEYPEAYNNMGNTLRDLADPYGAITCFKKALEVRPNYPEALNNMGNTFFDLENKKEAATCFEQAIEMKPDFTLAIGNLAMVYEKENRLDDAWKTASKALQYNSSAPIANLAAAKCERRRNNLNNALANLEKISLESCNSSIRAQIINEKALLYDRLGKFDKAFELFSEANQVTSRSWSSQRINKRAYIEKITRMKSSTTSFSSIHSISPGNNLRDFDPVFIVGFPRSGTTLLEQILDTRPDIQTIEEKPLVAAMINLLSFRGLRYPESLSSLDEDFIQDLRKAYFLKASEFLPEHYQGIFVDKLPLNIVDICLIHKVFPQSRIVLAMRHPLDICLSCFMQNFKLNESMIHFLNLEDTAILYDQVMTLWNLCAEKMPLNYRMIKYENIVTDFENETRILFRFLDLPWDPSVHDYHLQAKYRGTIATPSYHQVTEPIYKRSLYRWKNYSQFLRPLFEILNPHIERYGYHFKNDLQIPDAFLPYKPLATALRITETQHET